MESYRIFWKKSASKELQRINKSYIKTILANIDLLSANPFPPKAKKLINSEKAFRIKVGDYRIIYEVESNKLIIQIIRVKHRKDVYRK